MDRGALGSNDARYLDPGLCFAVLLSKAEWKPVADAQDVRQGHFFRDTDRDDVGLSRGRRGPIARDEFDVIRDVVVGT